MNAFGFMHLTYKQSLHKPDQAKRNKIIQLVNLEQITNVYICRNTNKGKKKHNYLAIILALKTEYLSFCFSSCMVHVTSWSIWRIILTECYSRSWSLKLSSHLKKFITGAHLRLGFRYEHDQSDFLTMEIPFLYSGLNIFNETSKLTICRNVRKRCLAAIRA